MKHTLKLMASTAIVAGVMAVSTPSRAEEQGWLGQMTTMVESWFAPETKTTSNEVEAYLDEVTIAVPPMADESMTEIQPAAGDTDVNYEEIENLHENETSDLNTDFDPNSTVTAFTDPETATPEELNTIETAAGDAEEITDESMVVVEEGDAEEITDESMVVVQETDDAEEITDESVVVTENQATETVETMTSETEENVEAMNAEAEMATQQAMDAAEEKINQSSEDMKKMVDEMNKQAAEAAAAAETETDAAADAMNDAETEMDEAEMMTDEESSEDGTEMNSGSY